MNRYPMPEDSGDFHIDTGFGHYRNSDDEHVRIAANSVNIPAREQRCLDALAEMPYGTAYDVGEWISLHDGTNEVPSNITPRLSSLHRKHLIKKTTFKRKSPMGKFVNCWMLVKPEPREG